jgi:hypothetical protein
MHRARTSLPYFQEFGWRPYVLAVDPDVQQGVVEPRLLNTVPPEIPVTRTGALPLAVLKRIGVRSVALRAFAHLYRAGARLIRREGIDLVYISTTMFPAMALGRLWHGRLGTPYVLDMQDPWVDDANESARRLPKARWARMLHHALEPFTMRRVSGLVAVSEAYHEALRRRYPWISKEFCLTVPFGGAEADFAEARKGSWDNPFFGNSDRKLHGVYAGAVSDPMRIAARILFRALKKAHVGSPRARNVDLVFVGSSYAEPLRTQKMVESDARREEIAHQVHEWPARIPYFDALRLLLEGDFIIILGSSDPGYVPSKLFQCLLARRPIVAVAHESSTLVELLRESRAAIVATFNSASDLESAAERLSGPLAELIERVPFVAETDASVASRFGARTLTQAQCGLFDSVMRHSEARQAAVAPKHPIASGRSVR